MWAGGRLRRGERDEGFAIVLVIATTTVLMALMLLATTTAVRSLVSSRQHTSFEGALAAAESGIDIALARTQQAYDTTGSDGYAVPSPTDPTCPGPTVPWLTPPMTQADERAWAATNLLALKDCRTHTPTGDYVFLKTPDHNAVYAMGWSPAYGAPEAKRRVIKSEYLFTTYNPTAAILTGGDLEISASTTVQGAGAVADSLASVHTNGNLTVGAGNPEVHGTVTQSGSGPPASSNKFLANASGTVTTSPPSALPNISARQVWGTGHASSPPGGWWDLCPDGTVRQPDGPGPCQGTTVGLGSWRGWSFNGSGAVPRWLATSLIKQNDFSGTFYVSGADVVSTASNAGSPVDNLTVIASSTTDTGCVKTGGNIDWSHIDISAPSMPGPFMVADQDLRTGANFTAGSANGGHVVSGFFIAGDQIEMQTSSAGAYGAVIAGDVCHPAPGASLVDSDVVKNPSIYYDPNVQTGLVDVVNTTLWLEYPAG